MTEEAPQWTPPAPADHAGQHARSIAQPEAFWAAVADELGVVPAGTAPVIEGDGVEHARFFPTARLNYAERLLRGGDEAALAIVGLDERGQARRITRGELRTRVARAAGALRAAGVEAGDIVGALVRNTPEAAIACLGAAALGATWSSANTDLGTPAALARFEQLRPKVLFVSRQQVQHGAEKSLEALVGELVAALPSVRLVVGLDEAPSEIMRHDRPGAGFAAWLDAATPLPPEAWPRLPFDHPLFVLFSSGTTGAPKGIVHGAGGTLLEHLKEHVLHGALGPGDVLLFQTTCGWMMWNWQLSALGAGAAIVLFDGSPTYPDASAFWRAIDALGVTALGTSPAYLQAVRDAGIVPREVAPLDHLRVVYNTGSGLSEAMFDWTFSNVKPVPIQSISGGTDIIGCFLLGHPGLPVWRGDSQCKSLGYDVRVLVGGEARAVGTGELVCCAPFPSRPVGFLGDADGARFHEAYFAANPGVWTHGDEVILRERGSARVLGRSDGVLNVRGVRIGPAELSSALAHVAEVKEVMALEQLAPREPGGSRLVLLVVLADGVTLDRPLMHRLKRELRDRASPHHVPAVIAQLPALPMTHNGKRSLRAALDALHGRPITNQGALKNPEVLPLIASHPALKIEDR